MKKKIRSSGGKELAGVKGYHSLLSQLSHKTISKAEFKRRSKLMLATLNK